MGPRREAQPDIHGELRDLPEVHRRHQFMNNVVAVIFAATAPVSRERLAAVIADDCNLDQLLAEVADLLRPLPFEIVKVAGGFEMQTRVGYGPVIRASGVTTPGRARPSQRQLQALAAIAYDQPITRKEVSEKIGAESDVAVGALREIGLIANGAPRRTVGTPPTYVTTEKFNITFRLDSVDDLPPLEEIELLRDRRPMPPELTGELPGSEDAEEEGDGMDDGREQEGSVNRV